MKKLLLLALVGIAAWVGSNNYSKLLHPQPYHEAVVRNRGSSRIERVRLSVGDQTFVRESLESGEAAVFPFRVNRDATFKLVWLRQGQGYDESWSGGRVSSGPLVQRHTITVDSRGVVYQAEQRETKERAK